MTVFLVRYFACIRWSIKVLICGVVMVVINSLHEYWTFLGLPILPKWVGKEDSRSQLHSHVTGILRTECRELCRICGGSFTARQLESFEMFCDQAPTPVYMPELDFSGAPFDLNHRKAVWAAWAKHRTTLLAKWDMARRLGLA